MALSFSLDRGLGDHATPQAPEWAKILDAAETVEGARTGCQTTDPLTAFIKASCLLPQLLY